MLILSRLKGILVVAVFAALGVALGRATSPDLGDSRHAVVADRAGKGAIAVWLRKRPGGRRTTYDRRVVLSRRPIFGVDFERSTVHFREAGATPLSFPTSDGVLLIDADGAVREESLPGASDLDRRLFEFCPPNPRGQPTVSFDKLRELFGLLNPRLRGFWD